MVLQKDLTAELQRIAKDLNIPKHVAQFAYINYWSFFRDTIKNIPNLDTILEEEFSKQKTSFNVNGIGKFSTDYSRVIKIRKKRKITKERFLRKHERIKYIEGETSS